MSAAEIAMQDIGAALESFYRGSTTSEDLCDTVAQINGAYSVERIGEFPPCPPRIQGDKPHCPDCSGIVGETGIA